LALLKIAFCSAPAFSSTSSACLREVTSPAPSETPIRVLVTSFPLAMVLHYGNLYCPVRTELASRSPISSTPRPPWAGYPQSYSASRRGAGRFELAPPSFKHALGCE